MTMQPIQQYINRSNTSIAATTPSIKSNNSHKRNVISCCYLNARRLVNQSMINSSCYDVICVSETWLSLYIFDREILPINYTIFRRDKPTRGRGVLIAVRNCIPISPISIPMCDNVESLSVHLTPVIVCCTYYSTWVRWWLYWPNYFRLTHTAINWNGGFQCTWHTCRMGLPYSICLSLSESLWLRV